MSASQQLPRITALLSVAATTAATTTIPSLRAIVSKVLGLHAPGGIWRLLAIILAVANLKNLPFVWHVR